ncbi:branched-chain amino acid ABC transporter permease [Azorhizobium oxalatiphilum]|uniref:Branched-chain amino acid ABC transporter permease n=1 Tax=Azorhizobium oxalatiphilum TaxID=980631 RepID=A0A917CAH6_9HYPH|nr:branched-chain amino acid ABC transporter permease [Azorhizobium oxalatiphilum]GGF76606.1 branched-chain amino acid ABC transporter permease [Azorhizobium oxalatiphilum]
MATTSLRPCGDYRSSYRADQTLFDTRLSMLFCAGGVVLLLFAPFVLSGYVLSLMIQIGYLGIAALGLNILVGFSGQISIGHAVFYGFGGFASCYLSHKGVPVPLAIVLAGLWTTAVGLLFGLPAARVKGLYLAIATLAAQFILQDFFVRATWFTGGTSGAVAEPFTLFGFDMSGDHRYFYVVLFFFVVLYLGAANLMRSRDGRALVAVRDHYLSAEMMGVNLTKYRTMAFGISSFYAGIAGALYAHYIGYMSVEGLDILFSIQFLAMIIIGGLGSVMGSLLGTIFMVLLPELTGALAGALQGSAIDKALHLKDGITYMREMLIGAVIILFLIFEPDGLAHRWRQIKAYWKLYPFSY